MSNPYGPTDGKVAGGAIEEFRFVEISSEEVTATNAVTDVPYGISLQKVASGERATLQVGGVAYLEVDGSGTAIVSGSILMPKATGAGVGVVAAGAGSIEAAKALAPATAASAVIPVLILDGTTVV